MTGQRLYTIPAGCSFVDMLARGMMDEAGGDPMTLARMQVLLPTRRACRTLREAFLRISDGKPLLLPRMSPLGDIDEEELSFYVDGEDGVLSLPPPCPPLRRKFLLARLIAAQGHGRSIEQDLMLADALGRLMDQVHTESLDLQDLPKIVDNKDFAAHWQVSIEFLSLLSVHWPKILEEQGLMDASQRRRKLMEALTAHWQKNPPAHRIIAAGSTGSIPATAKLLQTVASLPNGCTILPGLDQSMDDDSWKNIDETHPQAMLKKLLGTFGIEDAGDIPLWPAAARAAKDKDAIRQFVSETMRPPETAQQWQTLSHRLPLSAPALPIERYDCANPQQEALVIALALRRALEEDGTRAALVTPDRNLARRVAMACRRWGIEIDDSGGEPLAATRTGTFLRLSMQALCDEMKPVALLSFCKHALCQPESYGNRWRSDIRSLDATIFRGPAFEGGLESYDTRLAAWREKHDGRGLDRPLGFLKKAFAPLIELQKTKAPVSFAQWCEAHLRVCESFCAADHLWKGQDGEAASAFFSNLKEESALIPPMDAQDYLLVIEQAMQSVIVRPAYAMHPRLTILGQLEARLVETDVMILSGLNEGTWPAQPEADPWMSRPMRKKFGLPPTERSIGLSAHDFAQSLCADKVILTRAVRVDGTPSVPSRWLQRMDTVLQALGNDPLALQQGPLLHLAQDIDRTETVAPAERPAPRPPVDARPRRLSATAIDKWIGDPYSIYARYILKLKPLEPLERPLDAALRGTLIHEALDRFVAEHPKDLPSNAAGDFIRIAREEMDALALEDDIRALWEPRLSKIAHWIAQKETAWRTHFLPAGREAEGTMDFAGPAGPFTLSAIADRIDISRDGREGAIIDYKSGGGFSQSGMISGKYPQIPLEALILEAGGFAGVKGATATNLCYWIVGSGGEGGKEVAIRDPAKAGAAKDNARTGLQALIDAFDDPATPYYSLPRPDRAPRYNDYEHLARVREWTALDEREEEDAV